MHLDWRTSRGHRYYSVAQSIRRGRRVFKVRLAYLGRLDRLTPDQARSVLEKTRAVGDEKVLEEVRHLLAQHGHPRPLVDLDALSVQSALTYGPILAQHRIFEDLQISSTVRRHLPPKGGGLDLGAATEILALHRNCDPGSRRAAARWYPTTVLPLLLDLPVRRVNERALQRSLTRFTEERCLQIEKEIYERIKSLYGVETTRVDFDLTSVTLEGNNCVLAKLGYNRDGERHKKQVVLGFVIDQEGLLVMHRVFPGDRPDVKTLKRTSHALRKVFGITDPTLVADRGIVSDGNIAYLDRLGHHYLLALKMNNRERSIAERAMAQGSGVEYEPGTRIWELLEKENRRMKKYVVGLKEDRRREERAVREKRIRAAEEEMERLREGKGRARVRSRAERERRVGAILRRHGVLRFLRVEGEREGFGFRVVHDMEAIERAARWDGVFLFVTTRLEMSAKEVLESYRERDAIEKAVMALKSFLEIQPVYAQRRECILGHIFICALAYQIRMVMRLQMKRAGIEMSVERALEELDALKVVSLNVDAPGVQVVRRVTQAKGEVRALVDLFRVPLEAGEGV